jgi:hypothetical protein
MSTRESRQEYPIDLLFSILVDFGKDSKNRILRQVTLTEIRQIVFSPRNKRKRFTIQNGSCSG